MECTSSLVSSANPLLDPVTPQKPGEQPTQCEQAPSPSAELAETCVTPQDVLKRSLGDEATPAAKRTRVKRVLDPAKLAEQQAAKAKSAHDKAAEKAEVKAKKAEEKEAAKKAASAAKEADNSARNVRKMIGDLLKGKLKGKKKRVNGRRTYSVPGSTVTFDRVSPSDFDQMFSMYGVTEKRNGSKCVSLKSGQMQDIFGKTKCQGGSMYATFEISTANITYQKSEFHNDMELKITYKTQCTRESFW